MRHGYAGNSVRRGESVASSAAWVQWVQGGLCNSGVGLGEGRLVGDGAGRTEAREVARLQAVVDEEAEADGEGDEASGGAGEDVVLVDNNREHGEEEDAAYAEGDEEQGPRAGVGEAAEGIAWGVGFIAGTEEAFDVGNGKTALQHGEALVGFETALIGSAQHASDDGDHDYEKGGNRDEDR